MLPDMCIPCGDGFVNIRVGAIIEKDGKLLMVGNEDVDYVYSVGGRVRFGETAAQAVVREVWEETGTVMEAERLAFVEETYFYADTPSKMGKLIYEIGYYFYMKVPADFAPVCQSRTTDDQKEHLRWVGPGKMTGCSPTFLPCCPNARPTASAFSATTSAENHWEKQKRKRTKNCSNSSSFFLVSTASAGTGVVFTFSVCLRAVRGGSATGSRPRTHSTSQKSIAQTLVFLGCRGSNRCLSRESHSK